MKRAPSPGDTPDFSEEEIKIAEMVWDKYGADVKIQSKGDGARVDYAAGSRSIYAGEYAPEWGVTIRGKFYEGGTRIPKDA